MYHSRFKGSHYEAGYKWGKSVLKLSLIHI